MSIFNSLGSNYDFRFVTQSILDQNKDARSSLISFLEKKYNGQSLLFYKGREALTVALELSNLPKDSFVAVNGFTCQTVWEGTEKADYHYKFIDSEKNSLNFPQKNLLAELERNSRIKAVVIQNTLGYPCDIEKIEQVCKEKKLILIEDLAHCVGTNYADGREAGTVGDFVTLSFSQDKMIDAVSGGALIIRNKKFKNLKIKQLNSIDTKQKTIDKLYPLFTFKVRKTYDIGLGKPIHFFLKNFNLLSKPIAENTFYDKYSLPNWHCNLALLAFKKLPENLSHRKLIANIYKNNLDKKILWDTVVKTIPYSSNLRFPIFVENRNDLIEYLKKYKIYVSDIWYDKVPPECKNSYEISQKILNLPTHKNISEKDALFISEKVNEWLKSQ